MIRHAAAAAFPVVPLPVAVIEPPLLALLVPPVGVPPLLPLCFLPASLAAVPVAPVTMTTDPEHHATANPRQIRRRRSSSRVPIPALAAGRDNRGPSGQSWSHLQMTLGRFSGLVQKPDRRLTAGVFPFRLRPHPARAPASLTGDEDSTSRYRRPSQKSAALKLVIPCPLFPSAALNAALFLSDGHERMRAMARKRNGLVPAGEASGSLDGPVKAIRDTSPQAQRGFTQADQVNQLVSASEADPDLGFMARLMALCSLPRTNPGNRKEYKRVNGPYTLYMTAIGENKLPFGNLPRLLLAWVSTEAVRTQSRELVLGASLSEFMRTLGVYSSSGGRGGVQTRLRNQMKRLFNAHIQLLYQDKNGEATVNAVIADRTELWWTTKRPDVPSLWKSKIYLGEAFFNEIINHPLPLDMNILKALKRSSLGLDLYLWLTYRTFCPPRSDAALLASDVPAIRSASG